MEECQWLIQRWEHRVPSNLLLCRVLYSKLFRERHILWNWIIFVNQITVICIIYIPGVPQNVQVFDEYPICLANPKSTNLTKPSAVNMRFSGLRSRSNKKWANWDDKKITLKSFSQTIPRPWRNSKASRTHPIINWAVVSIKRPSFRSIVHT